jgi:spermidine synthase
MATASKPVYRGRDQYGSLQVYDEGGFRYLNFGQQDEQSCQLRAAPALLQHVYARAMLLVLLFQPQPRHITIFGLGGGCMATSLLQHLAATRVEVVELRAAVIDIARDYFQLPDSDRLSIVHSDVADYLAQQGTEKIDILFSDIFDGDGLNLFQLAPEFLQACAERLRPEGWLVLNCWNEHRGEHEALAALRKIFAEVRMCSTNTGNWVILASLKPTRVGKAELRTRARKLSARLGYSVTAQLNNMKMLPEA